MKFRKNIILKITWIYYKTLQPGKYFLQRIDMKNKNKSKKSKKTSDKTSTKNFFKKVLPSPTEVPTTNTRDGSTFQYSSRPLSQTTTVASSLDPQTSSSFEPHFDKQNPKTKLSKGEIIAITLGAVIGVTIIVLLLAIAVILYKRSKPVEKPKPDMIQEKPEPVHRPPAPFPRNNEPNIYEYIEERDLLQFQSDITGVYNTPGESKVSVDKHNYGTFHGTNDVGPVIEQSDLKTIEQSDLKTIEETSDLKTSAATVATARQTAASAEEHVYLVLEPP